MQLLNSFPYPTSSDNVSLLKAVELSVLYLDFKYYYCQVCLMTADKAFAVSTADIQFPERHGF